MRLFLIFLIFLVGCSVKTPQIGKKAFPQEDNYIMKSLFYENNKDYIKAAEIYKFLYDKTYKNIYFEKYLDTLFSLKKYDKVINEADKFLDKTWNDEVFKIKIFALLEKNRLNEAKKELLTKFNKKNEFFYYMMSYILIKQKKFIQALEYSKSSYALNPTKENLLNLVDVLIKNKKYNEALAYLNTRIKERGCEYDICIKLAQLYKSLYDYNRVAKIYEKLGEFDEKFYILALNYYMNEGKYKQAIYLVNKYNLDKEYLMYIYEQMQNYNKAALVAMNLYLKTKNLNYLLKYTIYIYKASDNIKTAKEVIEKLKIILQKIKTPFVYNFLGYILIDKEINVKEGLEYVKKAVEMQPDNIEYIDSLAWGYYKLKKCEIAWDIIKDIKTDEEIILKHKKMIKRCLDDSRKNHKSNKKRFREKKK